MSIVGFGMVMPTQLDMLYLIGWRLGFGGGGESTPHIPYEERAFHMRIGRASLALDTGQDFGYDLLVWQAFLLSDEEYGYTWNGHQRIDRLVAEAALGGERIILVELLTEYEERYPFDMAQTLQENLSSFVQKWEWQHPRSLRKLREAEQQST